MIVDRLNQHQLRDTQFCEQSSATVLHKEMTQQHSTPTSALRVTIGLSPEEAAAVRAVMSLVQGTTAAAVVRAAWAGEDWVRMGQGRPVLDSGRPVPSASGRWNVTVWLAGMPAPSMRDRRRLLRSGLGLPPLVASEPLRIYARVPSQLRGYALVGQRRVRQAALVGMVKAMVAGQDVLTQCDRLFAKHVADRPLRDSRRVVRMTVRIDPQTRAALGALAAAENWAGSVDDLVSSRIRLAMETLARQQEPAEGVSGRAVGAPHTERFSDAVVQDLHIFRREARALGNNANQMARGINALAKAVATGRIGGLEISSLLPEPARVEELETRVGELARGVDKLVTLLRDTTTRHSEGRS